MEDIILANQQLNEWCSTESINYYEGDTALGFLFKYAVPDDCTIQFQQHGDELDCVVFSSNEWYWGKAGKKEYAPALFWALWKVKEME